ncbi:MAG: NADH-quinone oxidoreductase subunit J family protein [Vulcanimicrobiaceae bacterium]
MTAFVILAVLLVASAAFVVSAKRTVYGVIGLLLNFICLAIMYLTLDAEFIAVIQVLVYSGAILMLFLFVIALLSSGVRPFTPGKNRLPNVLIPLSVFAIVAFAGLIFTYAHTIPMVFHASTSAKFGPAGEAGVFGSVADFGRALFTTYLLPFEATAFVLMIAVIGVVSLAGDIDPPRKGPGRRVTAGKREPIVKERA